MPLNIRPWEGPGAQFRPIVPELALNGKWGPPDMSKQLQEGIGSLMDTYDKSRLQAKQESSMADVARNLESQRAGGPVLPSAGPIGTTAPPQPGYNPAGKLPSLAGGGGTKTMPAAPEVVAAVNKYATAAGLNPEDVLTAMSYETAGSLDPWKKGPTTKWGEHRGLIQWGEPQRAQYGITADSSVDDQVAASIKYLQDRGVKPGMGMLEIYSAINAGGVGNEFYGRSDAAAGGAPGTVADKVANQMYGHRAKAQALLKRYGGGGGAAPDFVTQMTQLGIPPEKLAQIGDTPEFLEAMRTGRMKPSPNDPSIWTIDGKPVERPDWNDVLKRIPPGVEWKATPEQLRRGTPVGAPPGPPSGPPAAPTAQSASTPGAVTAPVVAGAPQKVASGAPGVVTRSPATEGATASGTNQAPMFQTPQMATATAAASQTPQQPPPPQPPPPQFQPTQPGGNPQQPPANLPAQGAQPAAGFFVPPGPQGQQPPPPQVRPGPGGNMPIPPPNAGGPIVADDPALRNPAAGAQGMMPQGGPGGAMPPPQAQRPPPGVPPAPATAAGGPAGGPGGMPPQLAQMMAQAGVQQPEMSANYAGAMAAAFRSGNPQVVQATANAINTLNQARQKNYQFLTSNGQVYRADPYTGAVEPVAGSGGAAGVETILRPGDPMRQRLGIDTAEQQDPRLWRLTRQSDGSIKPEPISNEPAREDKTFTQEDKLYERVADNPEFKKYRNASQGLDVLKSNFVEGSPEGDVASVFNFMKALDPTSTVARGEQAMASNASGPLMGLWSYYNNLLGSGSLTPEQRRRFYNTAIEAVRAQEPVAKNVVDEQRRRASAYKLNPDNVYIWQDRKYDRAEKDDKGNEPFPNKEGYNRPNDNAGGATKTPEPVKPEQAGATPDKAMRLPFKLVDGQPEVDVEAIRKAPNLHYKNSKGEVHTGYWFLGEKEPGQ